MLEVVVLAAGTGSRMRSRMPKAMHTVLDTPMLEYVLRAARGAAPASIHVIIRPSTQEFVTKVTHHDDINWIHQVSQEGTGHAVMHALPYIAKGSAVVIVNGDNPLISSKTITAVEARCAEGIAVATAELQDPSGYGRIERDSQGQFCAIIEDKDASVAQRAIREVNSGIIATSREILDKLLMNLSKENAQKELYLTEIIQLAVEAGISVQTVTVNDPEEVRGVNSRVDLAEVEKIMNKRHVLELMRQGLTVRDPDRLDIRGTLTTGLDCTIDVNVLIEGEVQLGDGVYVGPGSILRNTEIESDTRVLEYSVLESTKIGKRCMIGPFARIRPGTTLADGVKVGNFVEIKASHLGDGVKASHLAYIGDSIVGTGVNVGAGAITCNFDGSSKHQTVVGDDVFIGSNSTLIAPVNIHPGAFIAAGTTVTRDVKAAGLVVSRTRQREYQNWVPPKDRKTDD